jgi:addiction module RelE/StbE family toxin
LKLVWTVRSLGDRRQIYAEIEADSPRAAISVDERIEAAANRLLQFPESGRIGRIDDTRELVVTRTAFIIAYRIAGETVRILRVVHGARQWPERLSDET